MERKAIALIKNRSDIGAGTRGSDMGIDAMEIAAINRGSQFFNSFPFVDVPTRNYSVYDGDVNPFGRRIDQVFEQCDVVAQTVQQTLQNEKFPLVFSGDHSSAIGTISGIKAALSDQKLGVIWIDAHADIHSPYTTPSGNMHGMPLAAVMHIDNRECQINELDAETSAFWEKLKTIGTPEAKLKPEHLVYFGVRDTEEPEDKVMERLGIKNYTVDEVRRTGLEVCVAQALARLADCDIIYVSFDVDSMDSQMISAGTGTPVPKGFIPSEIIAMLEQIVESDKVACLEVVEVNPLLDKRGNRMAEVAFDIVEYIAKRIGQYLV